jgi:cytochrome c-type biogenesis protein CcmH
LLSAASLAEPEPQGRGGFPLALAAGAIPAAALGLYLIGGSPGLPAEPLAERIALNEARQAQMVSLMGQLRAKIATLDPQSEEARQGYVLLGNAEAATGDLKAAASAWQSALAIRFEPVEAVKAAEALRASEGGMSLQSAALFRRALSAAPADAPWRPMVEQRLQEMK